MPGRYATEVPLSRCRSDVLTLFATAEWEACWTKKVKYRTLYESDAVLNIGYTKLSSP